MVQVAHLMRRRARQAGLDLSVRALMHELAAIGETVLIYPCTGGRPKARQMPTELTGHQRGSGRPSPWTAGPPLGHRPGNR